MYLISQRQSLVMSPCTAQLRSTAAVYSSAVASMTPPLA